MLKVAFGSLLCIAVVMFSGCCREEAPLSPKPDRADYSVSVNAELAAGEVILACGWQFDPDTELPSSLRVLLDGKPRCIVQEFERVVVCGDIALYSIVLSVGPGEYDVIGLHRVVRELRPHVPIRSRDSVFLVHGMGKDFVGNFLPGLKSALLPDDIGFAVFMAQNGVDVWGLDSSYLLVPGALGDFGFAREWGMDKSIDDIGTGIAVARLVRLFTGNGLRKMTLLGYSQGSVMGYAFLNGEAQMPPGRRSVSSFIPVDWGLAYDDPGMQADECEYLSGYVDLYHQGVYGFDDDPDGFYASIGILARDDPDGDSPYYEGFSNLEVFMFFTAVGSPPFTSHFWAGIFDEDGMPVDFTYTTRLMAAEFWINWAPMHPPIRLWLDFHSIFCGDSVWETHIGQIRMPVFSLEAAGGSGIYMTGTLDRLISADVTRHVVQLHPPEDALLDFGHVDLFTAENAMVEAWQPTLQWIRTRSPKGGEEAEPMADVLAPEMVSALNSLDWTAPAPGRILRAQSPTLWTGGTAPSGSMEDVVREARSRRLWSR